MSSSHDGVATPFIAIYVIFRQKGKIAFLLREHTGWMNGHYTVPAGRVDNGESYLQAAMREAKEEVGVDVLAKDFQLVLTACRKHPDSYWVDAVFEAKEWSGELYNAEPHVHGELTWFAPMELPENVVPNVREYMAYLEAGKNYIEIGWDEEA